MSARVPTTEMVANVYEVGDVDEANYRRRTERRQAFFAWLSAHDAEKRAEWDAMSEYTPTTEQIRTRATRSTTYPQFESPTLREEWDRWLAAHDAEVRAESAEALDRAKRGAKTLGEIVERQVEDTLRWAGIEDQIGLDDPDQQLAWELCAEMPGKIAALEAELAEVRAGVVTEEPEWEYDVLLTSPDLPPTIHRRRSAGPWVPVKQEGAETDG